jgi:DNA-binding XRE family transcriptional regulator
MDKQELIELREQRDELKATLAVISKRIHILSTSISQYEKKCVKNAERQV